MAEKEYKKSYKKGYRHEIIMLLLTVGIIPKTSLPLWEDKMLFLQRKLRAMKKEELIEECKRDGYRYWALKDYNKHAQEYMGDLDEDCKDWYKTNGYIGKKMMWEDPKNPTRAERAYNSAEIFALMYKADVRCFPNEKPKLCTAVDVPDACYYSSVEFKKYKDIKFETKKGINRKIYNSRFHGILFADGNVYPVYNLGNNLIGINQISEEKARLLMEEYCNTSYTVENLNTKVDSAILYTSRLQVYLDFVRPYTKKSKRNAEKPTLINMEYVYRNIYLLSYDAMGKMLTKIMCNGYWKEYMMKLFFQNGEKLDTRYIDVACDAYMEDTNEFILLFCIPNLVKLKQFVRRAELDTDEKRYKVICFEEQLPLIAPLAFYGEHPIFRIETVAFSEFLEEWKQKIEV